MNQDKVRSRYPHACAEQVTAPLWGGLVLIFAVLLVAVLVAALAGKR